MGISDSLGNIQFSILVIAHKLFALKTLKVVTMLAKDLVMIGRDHHKGKAYQTFKKRFRVVLRLPLSDSYRNFNHSPPTAIKTKSPSRSSVL